MNRELLADLINDVSAAIGWNHIASEKAGQGRIRECREKLEWVDKSLRQLLERLGVTYKQIEETRESMTLEEDIWHE